MEMILGGIDLDAETGERWGYFNRALPAGDPGAYVDGERDPQRVIEAMGGAAPS
jgi:hypothetical protein